MQMGLFKYSLRRRTVRELVIDPWPLYAVAGFFREVEMVSARAGMVLAIAAGADQERHLCADALAAQVETRIGARSQPVKGRARNRLALPHHAACLRPRFANVYHQRCAVRAPHS